MTEAPSNPGLLDAMRAATESGDPRARQGRAFMRRVEEAGPRGLHMDRRVWAAPESASLSG
jgi:uncharacterized protein (DUF2342 family)